MTYDKKFYDNNYKFQKALSDKLTPWIIENLKPQSVIDFGCGCGKFLQDICDRRTNDYDGLNFNKPFNLMLPLSHFHVMDFANLKFNNPDVIKKYDLVISLEVAEHLPESSADTFIKSLVAAANKYILFSAATPGQGGIGHCNEQPTEYWMMKFAASGFVAHDVIRPILKNEKTVPFWYRQNIFLFKKVGI